MGFSNFTMLNKRIMLQNAVNSKDEMGASITEWQAVAEVWAAVKLLKPSMKLGEVEISECSYRVIIREGAELNKDMRIKFGRTNLKIDKIGNYEEANGFLIIYCREV